MEQEDQSLNQIKTFLKENNNLWKKKKIKFFLPFTSSEQFDKSNVYIVMWRVVLHVNKVSDQSCTSLMLP